MIKTILLPTGVNIKICKTPTNVDTIEEPWSEKIGSEERAPCRRIVTAMVPDKKALAIAIKTPPTNLLNLLSGRGV